MIPPSLIAVGTRNPVKIAAVEELKSKYPFLATAKIFHFDVASGVPEQPIGFEEIIRGARYRASLALARFERGWGIGIESGIIEVPTVGFMDICACVINAYEQDSNQSFVNQSFVGLSGAWTLPSDVVKLVFSEGINLSQAFKLAGLSERDDLGDREGAIGVLTQGRLTRKEYTKQAIEMALVGLQK